MAQTKREKTHLTKVVLVLSDPERRALHLAVEATATGDDDALSKVFGAHHHRVKAARRMREKILEALGKVEDGG